MAMLLSYVGTNLSHKLVEISGNWTISCIFLYDIIVSTDCYYTKPCSSSASKYSHTQWTYECGHITVSKDANQSFFLSCDPVPPLMTMDIRDAKHGRVRSCDLAPQTKALHYTPTLAGWDDTAPLSAHIQKWKRNAHLVELSHMLCLPSRTGHP